MILHIIDKLGNVASHRPYSEINFVAGNGCVWFEANDQNDNKIRICLEPLDLEQIANTPKLSGEPNATNSRF